MHSCKVQSHPAAHVQPSEYEEQRKRISLGLFPSALLKAQEQVMGKEHAWELRYYQREFSLPLSRNIFGLFTIPVYINHVRAVLLWIQEHRSAASRVKNCTAEAENRR